MKYQRVLLKLSGEAFSGSSQGIAASALSDIAETLAQVQRQGTQLAVVVGAGNFWRGARTEMPQVRPSTKDHIGILATGLNALALRDALLSLGVPAAAYGAHGIASILPQYELNQAMADLSSGSVVIAALGTGNPFVTTDSAAALRGIELEVDCLLKATTVDGVYDKDPNKYADARLLEHVTFQDAIDQSLSVMDMSAFCQCQVHDLNIRVFNLFKEGALLNAVNGGNEGSLVSNESM